MNSGFSKPWKPVFTHLLYKIASKIQEQIWGNPGNIFFCKYDITKNVFWTSVCHGYHVFFENIIGSFLPIKMSM